MSDVLSCDLFKQSKGPLVRFPKDYLQMYRNLLFSQLLGTDPSDPCSKMHLLSSRTDSHLPAPTSRAFCTWSWDGSHLFPRPPAARVLCARGSHMGTQGRSQVEAGFLTSGPCVLLSQGWQLGAESTFSCQVPSAMNSSRLMQQFRGATQTPRAPALLTVSQHPLLSEAIFFAFLFLFVNINHTF